MSKDLVVYGISHHKAPVSVRERLAASPEQATAELSALRPHGALSEGVLLSTCNRVELIGTTDDPLRAREEVLERWNLRFAPERVNEYVYEHRGLDAVRHLFHVASGLDSMVLGEPQILGQVKDAWLGRAMPARSTARSTGCSSTVFMLADSRGADDGHA